MANNVEMKAHEGTYDGFLSMLKWGIALVALIATVVILLIAG